MSLPSQLDFDDEQIEAASHWYGGMGDMLYAVSSTGALKRGSRRPKDEDGQPLDDDTWLYELARQLNYDAHKAAKEAERQAKEIEKKLAEGYYDTDREELELQNELSVLVNETEALQRIEDEAQEFCDLYETENK